MRPDAAVLLPLLHDGAQELLLRTFLQLQVLIEFRVQPAELERRELVGPGSTRLRRHLAHLDARLLWVVPLGGCSHGREHAQSPEQD